MAEARRTRAAPMAATRCVSQPARRSSSTGCSRTTSARPSRACMRSLLDTIAACGDVSRSVMCAVEPEESRSFTPRSTRWPSRRATTRSRRPAPITRSGTARNASASSASRRSRSTASSTCRGSSRSASWFRRRTTSTSTPRISASSRSRARRGSRASTSRSAAAWAAPTSAPETYPRLGDVIGFIASRPG